MSQNHPKTKKQLWHKVEKLKDFTNNNVKIQTPKNPSNIHPLLGGSGVLTFRVKTDNVKDVIGLANTLDFYNYNFFEKGKDKNFLERNKKGKYYILDLVFDKDLDRIKQNNPKDLKEELLSYKNLIKEISLNNISKDEL